MGEVTLKVPAEYVETLRAAVIDDVEGWTEAVKKDQAEIRGARETRDDKLTALREDDLGNHFRTLSETAALVNQLPAPGARATAELHADSSVFEAIAEEAARVCIKSLASELDYAPLVGGDLRRKMEELGWWVSQEESHEAARLAEVESSKAEAN